LGSVPRAARPSLNTNPTFPLHQRVILHIWTRIDFLKIAPRDSGLLGRARLLPRVSSIKAKRPLLGAPCCSHLHLGDCIEELEQVALSGGTKRCNHSLVYWERSPACITALKRPFLHRILHAPEHAPPYTTKRNYPKWIRVARQIEKFRQSKHAKFLSSPAISRECGKLQHLRAQWCDVR